MNNHRLSLSSHLQNHPTLPAALAGSVSCVGHAWMELLGDRGWRVSGAKDYPLAGTGEGSGRGQSPGQGVQTRNQGGILQ